MGWFDRWLQERRRRRHQADRERQDKAREEKLKTIDLSKYGVHQVPMGMWAADGVTKLFIHPEDALAAKGWAVCFGIGGELWFEPWGAEAVYPCGLRPGSECLDLPGCDFWCHGKRDEDEKVSWDCT